MSYPLSYRRPSKISTTIGSVVIHKKRLVLLDYRAKSGLRAYFWCTAISWQYKGQQPQELDVMYCLDAQHKIMWVCGVCLLFWQIQIMSLKFMMYFAHLLSCIYIKRMPLKSKCNCVNTWFCFVINVVNCNKHSFTSTVSECSSHQMELCSHYLTSLSTGGYWDSCTLHAHQPTAANSWWGPPPPPPEHLALSPPLQVGVWLVMTQWNTATNWDC